MVPGSARFDRAIFWTIYAQEKPNKGEPDAGLQFAVQQSNPFFTFLKIFENSDLQIPGERIVK
jgi:hypothetical protein